MSIRLSANLIESFSGTFLSPRFDDARAVPPFHRKGWELYTSSHPQCVLIAPRDHAKSTSFTFVYILAEVCFRVSDYVILIGSTEDKAAEQLSNISEELEINQDLRAEFGIVGFDTMQKTEVIVRCDDGFRFRIIARGAEQKIRGAMWKGKRPNLIVCDDMEDDEQVESKERRAKFRRWFFRAAKQALSKSGKIRVHGTILHDDSLLSRLRKNKTWHHLFFKAHRAYSDFSELLWPARWSVADLLARRTEFEQDGDSAGYSQEFLNTPMDNSSRFIRPEDMIPMDEERDYESDKVYGVGVDFAVSKADAANRTSFTVGGKDVDNIIHIVDQSVGRWDTLEWLDELFTLNDRWEPEVFWVEGGQIWLSVQPFLYDEMRNRDVWINIEVIQPIKDKATRGRAFQRRSRAGGIRYYTEGDWYPEYQEEILRFTGVTQAMLDDQFDSTALLIKGFDVFRQVEPEDFLTEEELEFEQDSEDLLADSSGRASTGY